MSSPPRRATKGWDGPSSRQWRSGFPLSAPRWAGSQPSWWTASAGGSCRRRTRSEEHTSELQSLAYLVCRLLLEKKKKRIHYTLVISRDGRHTQIRIETREVG